MGVGVSVSVRERERERERERDCVRVCERERVRGLVTENSIFLVPARSGTGLR